jgi:hypothetical protein
MRKFSALRKSLLVAAALGLTAVLLPVEFVQAQESPKPSTVQPAPRRAPGGVGGTSLTLSDVWGPAEMPPAPKDFGPHFDFPPEALGGGLTHDPYPN